MRFIPVPREALLRPDGQLSQAWLRFFEQIQRASDVVVGVDLERLPHEILSYALLPLDRIPEPPEPPDVIVPVPPVTPDPDLPPIDLAPLVFDLIRRVNDLEALQ